MALVRIKAPHARDGVHVPDVGLCVDGDVVDVPVNVAVRLVTQGVGVAMRDESKPRPTPVRPMTRG